MTLTALFARRARRVLWSTLLGMSACFTTSGSAQTTAAAGAPLDMKVAIHSRGFFKDKGGGDWTEHGPDGKVIFRFRETRRTESAVFLYDAGRKVTLELNVPEKMVYYSDTKTTRAKLIGINLSRTAERVNYFQVKSDGKCLQAVYIEGTRSYSPELMEPCDESPGQLWNVEVGRTIDGTPTYRWRNMWTQMRGVDLCLRGAFANALVTMDTCDTHEAQRWVHAPPPVSPAQLRGLRTVAVQGTVCLGVKRSTEGAPRYRKDEAGVTRQDTEFRTLHMVFCGGRNDSGSNNDPAWLLSPR
jgi:hypothetical protein